MKYFSFIIVFLIATLKLSSQNISIAGEWQFSLDEQQQGEPERWYSRSLADRFLLPGSNVENLKGNDISLKTRFTGSIYDSSWYFNPHLERYRIEGNIKVPFWLTQNKYYVGYAWYSRNIQVPSSWKGKQLFLFLERPHFITRIWIDNQEVGTFNSLNTPHVFDITSFVKPAKQHKLTIRIDNSLKDIDVGSNSHSVTDHTQGNWNGIVGRIELQARNPVYAEEIQVFPDLKNKKAIAKIKLVNRTGRAVQGSISLNASAFNTNKSSNASVNAAFSLLKDEGNKEIAIELPLGDNMLTWCEFDPALYKLEAVVQSKQGRDTSVVSFGMREVSIEGKWIYINGRKTLMRGTVENALFPLTGYPPMDVPSWERIFRICKAWGLNHVRFHSWGPPEAAFKAADLVGIYLQPEGPSWPNHSTQLGRGLVIDTYLMEETKRMVKHYGNYASFVMLAAGNEPRGNWVPWVSNFVNYWKKTDSRRIYTGASVGGSWSWQPANQFHVKAGARGLNWSRTMPESLTDFSNWIDTVRQPFISHETGQWCAFPNFDEIKKYTGTTRARNFELFQEELERSGMGDMNSEFLMASGNLQVLCYKHEIEKTLRTPDYAGFQLLSLNDFSGQGTALVGVLDAFWDEKGYVKAPEFRRFCNTTVPLLRTSKFVYRNNEMFNADAEIAHFGKEDMQNARVVWRIRDAYGLVLEEHKLSQQDIPIGSKIQLGKISFNLSKYNTPVKLNLEIAVAGTDFANDWDFWVYPAQQPAPSTDGIYITKSFDDQARKVLETGGKVLVMAAGKVEYGKDVVQYYSPVFWNTSWFKMRPPHTTGVFINHYHPVFKGFVTENWANMQWWELVNRAQTMLLNDFPRELKPIVQPIDTWFINRRLGMLFEARVGKGRLMMTSMDLENLTNRPVAECLYQSIISYMQSGNFRPETEVTMQQIQDIFQKTAPPINSFSRSSPDELRQGAI